MARVVHVVFSGDMAGGQKVCLEVIRDRVAMGDTVTVVTPSRGSFTQECGPSVSIRLLRCTTFRDVLRIPRAVALLRRLEPDVVHTHLTSAGNVVWRIVARLARAPLIQHVHAANFFGRPGPKERLARRLDRYTTRFCRRFIAVSRDTANGIIAEGYPPDRVRVVYNGVSTAGLRQQTIGATHPDRPVIGCVARLSADKGQRELILAMREVLRVCPGARLRLVGKDQESAGRIEDELRELARSLRLGDAVEFLGERSDVQDLMAAMDLIVLPSFHEAMPLVMLEAMAIGVPVVASRVAGIPEIITDGVTGLLVEPGDVNGIAAAIIRLLQDPGLARTIGGNGRARVEEELNVERMLDGVRRVYAEVSEEHGAPGN